MHPAPTAEDPETTPRQATRSTIFGSLTIQYDDRVLTPRRWTTAQSAWAAEMGHDGPPGRLLELCTGAGHIGLLALETGSRDGVLVDIDPVACQFARANAEAAGLAERVEIRHSPIGSCLSDREMFAVVVADPPWVPDTQTDRFPGDPLTAIDGGTDGLDLARECLRTIDACLHPNGAAVLQLGSVAQASLLGEWMGEQRDPLDLMVDEVRVFGDRGVLLLLRRPATR
ncbi:MAG: RsmD family RNA methyltransferase [Nocardioides sp.]|uniref:RsmD family RNA methyltransferase n=1 Tax=Nocardioides sp. TaxID=35761 RepID=UPI003D6AF7A5